jgi:DNA-binding transcriptional LysR family regulator
MPRFDERMLNGIGVFAAIVDAGSFAAAGERLDMSQPGVSRAIARLEGRLRIRLFDRTTRVIAITEEGRRLHEQVVPLLAALEDAASGASPGAVRGKLRVNVDPLFSSLILGPRLGEFLARYPDLQLELLTRDRAGDLVSEGFDVAVRFGIPRDSSLVARKLLETPVVTVATPAYLRRAGRPAKPQDLENQAYACIEFRDPETARPFPWEFHRKRKKIVVAVQGRLILNDPGTLLSTCLAGYGITQVLEVAVTGHLAAGRLVSLFPEWPDERYPLYSLHPSRHHPPAKTRAFLDFVASLAPRE